MSASVRDAESPVDQSAHAGPSTAPLNWKNLPGAREISLQLRELSRVSTVRGLAAVAFDWSIIIGCFAVAANVRTPIVWIVAALIIAMRQHALLILMHDASHYRLLAHRTWNDRISNWFLAWPLLVSTEGYRENHMAHHLHLNTGRDPDWVRKNGKPAWKFPQTRRQIAWLLIRELLGGGFLDAIRSITDLSGKKLQAAEKKASGHGRLIYYGIVGMAIGLSGLWFEILLLWFLPAFTFLTVILRIRSIAEHFGIEGEHDLNSSRNIHPRVWERFALAPHNCGYHLDHHLYPSVPFYNLPKLHGLLKSVPEYADHSHQSQYFIAGSNSTVLAEISSDDARNVP